MVLSHSFSNSKVLSEYRSIATCIMLHTNNNNNNTLFKPIYLVVKIQCQYYNSQVNVYINSSWCI